MSSSSDADASSMMDDALRRAAESQMRRRAPDADGDDDGDARRDAKRARETTTTTTDATTTTLGRFAYGALRTFIDVDAFRGAVFATCAQSREHSASKDLARALARAMGAGKVTLEPVKLPGRGAVLLRAAAAGERMDAAATTREAMRLIRSGEIAGSRFLEKMYPIDGAFEAGDEAGTRAACARCVAGARRRSEKARGKRASFAVVYRRLDDGSSDVKSGVKASSVEDAAHGRRRLTPRVAEAVKEAFAAEDATCEVRVDLKDPDVVVFVEVFCAREGDGGDDRVHVVTVGACVREDEVFEVKSRGISPASVSTFWKAPPPKWMIEKGLATAPPAPFDDEDDEARASDE